MNSVPPDLAPTEPSEKLAAWMKDLHLHPVTWLLVAVAVLRLGADTVDTIADMHSYFSLGLDARGRSTTAAEMWAGIAHAYGYSLALFGTAATVEFLFRIWRELRVRRTGEPD
jgi:hypothetical protein